MTGPLPAALAIEPLAQPPDARVRVPGSKSLTNRALVCAGLAAGTSTLSGVLVADDTRAMAGALGALGVDIALDEPARTAEVRGVRSPRGGAGQSHPVAVDAVLSGTTARFMLPIAARADGWVRLDGRPPLRRRPIGPLLEAIRTQGAAVIEEGEPGCLPLLVHGGGLRGGVVRVAGDVSSQFATALLLVGPTLRDGLRVEVTGDLVARPFVDMTVDVMRHFGAEVHEDASGVFTVAPSRYRAVSYTVEPDATAASYFFAAAAMTGGRVRVEGFGPGGTQGDLAFLDVLAAMGASVTRRAELIEVVGPPCLRGVDVDLRATPDVAQTLAVVAAVAEGPTVVRGIEVVRGHETDRIAAVVTELRQCGVQAEERPDGFVVEPGAIRPAEVATYDDHRMAMSFALLGLVAPGIVIRDPGCVSKTFPDYFDVLATLRRPVGSKP